MLIEYIEEALRRAQYKMIENDDEPYFGEVDELEGVWAVGKTLEECRETLKDVIEGWIMLGIKENDPFPKLGDFEIKEIKGTEIVS
ncbi:MAG TPA: type II toxin-antitoxin system HicB family antitoxin [Spirochaetes bacterium]|nr:type II toxin-antitoxin system HicB family antitoxin [Spirochaetota bacterium]